MKKRTLSLLLCLVMCLTLMPMSAFAADIAYDVWVGGVRVTSANKDNILDDSGTPTATYDPDTNTLTLNDYGGGYINADTALDIVLADGTENAISVPAEVAECGIRINGDCTIRGNGDLNIEVLNPSYDGVWVGGDLTVDMTGDLTVNAGDDGLYANNNLTISGSGDVDIDSHYYGICADGGDVVIPGAGDVTVKAATATGIYGCESVIVSGDGDLTVTSNKHGIYTDNGNITISGGGNRTFYSTYGSDNEYFRAVYSYQGDIDISGTGTLTIASALSSSSEYDVGLYSYWGSLRVSGSVVLDISDVNIGTYSEKATTFASSGEMTVDASVWGVGSSDDIIFSGTGKATISGGEYGAYLSESGKSVLLNGTGAPISLTAGEGYKAVWNDADSSSPVGGTNIANYDVTGAPNEQSVVYTLKCSHTPVTITGKVATCTEDGWKDYYECSLCHKYFEDNACEAEIADLDVWKAAGGNGYIAPKGHTYGEWATTKEPTLTEKGMKERSCTACGDKQTEEIPVLTPATYSIISGANGEWTKGETEGLLITSDAPFAKYDSVKIDGTVIAAANYTAEAGSTKITLAPAYLETLSVGTHTIEIVSKDGSASTNFTVKSAEQPPVVPTNYTVTFNMNGHGDQITAQTVKEGEKATKPTDPTASGWTFNGWYADATFSAAFDFDAAINANTTVYAKWTENTVPQPPVPEKFTVSFNMNGHGTQVAEQTVEDGSKATKPTDPTASGYTFGGWYADATFSAKFDFNTAITANTTVYAKWTKNSVAPTDPTSPQTGDNSHMFLWIALLLVSGGALVGTTVYGKKRKRAE